MDVVEKESELSSSVSEWNDDGNISSADTVPGCMFSSLINNISESFLQFPLT